MKKTGIYIHIPFCEKKCPYCDFYSRSGTDKLYNEYTEAMLGMIGSCAYRKEYIADSLYFGGGTPGLLGAERLISLVGAVKGSFGLDTDNSEVTAEINPSKQDIDLELLRKGGVNRISIGVQSADDSELTFLGRQHSSSDAAEFIRLAKKAGFENISLDLMIALPGQTKTLTLAEGFAPYRTDIPDTWIFSGEEIETVGIAAPDRRPWVTMQCGEFPMLAVWANPAGPFICLEPWFGRTDDDGFTGTLAEKPGMETLDPGTGRHFSYSMEFHR